MRLKEIRKARGISQIKLAMDLNMAQNTISRYETGVREPSIAELVKIADYFHVSVDYLLGRTNNPNIQVYTCKLIADVVELSFCYSSAVVIVR